MPFYNYEYIDTKLLVGRCKYRRKMMHNTYLERTTPRWWPDNTEEELKRDIFELRFHKTAILTYFPDGTRRLAGRGWSTNYTTRVRWNEFLGDNARVYNNGRMAFISTRAGVWAVVDDMDLHPDHTVTGSNFGGEVRDLYQRIDNYTGLFIKKLFWGQIAKGSKDCRTCAAPLEGGGTNTDASHHSPADLLQHVVEEEFPPSLLMRAFLRRHSDILRVLWQENRSMLYPKTQRELAALGSKILAGEPVPDRDEVFADRDDLKIDLRNYLRMGLGF